MKQRFGLYLILTDPVAGYEACAEAAVAAGVRYLQLRVKNASPAERLDVARRLRAITRDTDTLFIVNDDLETAMASDADGAHFGQDDLTIETARATWAAPGKRFGLSTHSMDQAERAVCAAPDLIGVGPVFPTATKPDAAPALGIDEVGRIARATPITSVAIGGINEDNLLQLLDAGVDNFCVVSAVNGSRDPAAAIGRLQRIWKHHCF